MQQPKPSENSFPKLWKELKDRLCLPVGQVSFWVNLITGVFMFGGIGVWFELLRLGDGSAVTPASPSARLDPLVTALFTYFPALGWASAMQVVMADELPKYLRSTANGVAAILLVVAVVFLFRRDLFDEQATLGVGIVSCLVAILMWWIANARENIFTDQPRNGEASVSGDPTRPLQGSAGDFKV